MKAKNIIILMILTALMAATASAGGLIIVNPPAGSGMSFPNFNPYMLESESIKVETDIEGRHALTNIEQVFVNPSQMRLEGYFLFPVPKNAVLKNFSMDINGQMVEAELLDAGKAKKIYEDIVRQMRDPALLEYSNQSMFRVRIFPIEPGSRKHIRIKYSEILDKDNNSMEYTFPLNTKKFAARPVGRLAMRINIQSDEDIKTIYSPSHDVEIIRKGSKKAVAGMEATNVKPDRDFKLLISTDRSEVGLSLLSLKNKSEDGYFFLDITPGFVADNEEIAKKDITFVLDVSGSMAGEKLNQAKKALLYCINNLNDDDRFEIVKFSTEAKQVFGKLSEASADNLKRANDFIRKLKAVGGTNIDDALETTLKNIKKGGRPNMIVFITDGKPTIGVTDMDKLLDKIRKYNTKNTKIFTFGIGYDINTHLLDKITECTKSYRSYIEPGENIEVKVSDFFDKVSSPVLTDLSIEFPAGSIAYMMLPKSLPDLFKGSSVNVLGRYEKDGPVTITLKGKVNGRSKQFTYKAELRDNNEKYDFIPALWAARKIGWLLDQIRLNGESKELVDEVTLLAKNFGIITPYTSYLILEDERINISNNNLPPDRVIFNNRAIDDEAFLRKNETHYKAMDAEEGAGSINSSIALQDMNQAVNIGQVNKEQDKMYYTDKNGRNVNFAEQVRNIQGRAVYQNGDEWIDLYVQQKADLKDGKKIKFGTDEYFSLMNDEPGVAQFLSLGKNVRFVYKGHIYEIYE